MKTHSVFPPEEELGEPTLPHTAPVPSRLGWLFEGPSWTYLRLAFDVLLLALALVAARIGAPGAIDEGTAAVVFFFPSLTIGLMALRGLYRRKIQLGAFEMLGHIVGATSLAAMLLIAVAAIIETSNGAAGPVARMWVFATVYLGGGRLVLLLSQRRARVNRLVAKPTIIVGAGHVGAQVERRLLEQPEFGLRPIGYLDHDPPPADAGPGRRLPVLGPPSSLSTLVEEHKVQHVILAFISAPDSVLLPIIRECEARKLEISIVPRLFESVNVRVALEHIGGLPLYGLRSVDPKGWQFTVKHALDRIAAAFFVVVLSPLLIAAALATRLSSPGPVFFRQPRIGRDGHEFEMLKFRTMAGTPEERGEADAAWAAGIVGGGDAGSPGGVEHRTRVGRFLRAYSIDELPQLLNVLRGDMSLVGPRPERTQYVRMFEESVYRYGDRHRVKSGLTGWAQVHGLRGNTSLGDRVEWDNYYIANWSLMLDLKILLMTLRAVLRPAD